MAIKSLLKIDFIFKLPLSKKIIIVAVIDVIIALLFYQFLIGPQRDEVAELRNTVNDLTVQLDDSRRIAKDIPAFEKEKEELEGQLKSALAQLPNEKEIPSLIDSISDAAKKSGLKILLFRPRPETPKGFYAEVPVDMDVEGTYDSLYGFCEKVSRLPRIVNIEGINVTLPDMKNIANPVPGINAKFVAMTFRFVPDEGQGAQPAKARGE